MPENSQSISVVMDVFSDEFMASPDSIDNGYVFQRQDLKYTVRITAKAVQEPIGTIIVTDTVPGYVTPWALTKTKIISSNGDNYDVTAILTGKTLTVDTKYTITQPYEWIELSFLVRVMSDAPHGEALLNDTVITAASGLPAPVTSNTVKTTVLNELAAFKQVAAGSAAGQGGSPVKHGDVITYQIDYGNPTAGAVDTIITDTLAPGLDFAAASGGGSYNPDTREVSWAVGMVESMAYGSVTVKAAVNASAFSSIENTASADFGGEVRASNTVQNALVKQAPTKTAADSSPAGQNGSKVRKGDTIIYTIAYKNETNNPSQVIISDTLSFDLDYVTSSAPGIYDPDTRTVSWAVNSVPAGAAGTVSLTVRVNQIAAVQLANYAAVQVGEDDPMNTSLCVNPVAGSALCENTGIKTKCRQTIKGKVLWEDNMNLGDTRPPVVHVVLLRGGELYRSMDLDTAKDSAFAFYCVPTCQNAQHMYKYTVNELPAPEGYVITINGNVITNTLV